VKEKLKSYDWSKPVYVEMVDPYGRIGMMPRGYRPVTIPCHTPIQVERTRSFLQDWINKVDALKNQSLRIHQYG
jgi:hypothetical protein